MNDRERDEKNEVNLIASVGVLAKNKIKTHNMLINKNDDFNRTTQSMQCLYLPGFSWCWNIVVVAVDVVDRFYTALFSALEQTHCTRMWFYMSE